MGSSEWDLAMKSVQGLGVGGWGWGLLVADNATLDCCKMRCQTSHLTMQTSKWAFNWGHGWATCATVYLFACPQRPRSVRWLAVCLYVCLAVSQTDGLKAQGCCRCRRCTCATSSRTPLAAVCVGQTEPVARGQRAAHKTRNTRKKNVKIYYIYIFLSEK